MKKLTILGRDYELTTDEFGITYIDGLLPHDWLKTVDRDTLAFVVNKGASIGVNQPEYFDDIADRVEMSPESRKVIEDFRNDVK